MMRVMRTFGAALAAVLLTGLTACSPSPGDDVEAASSDAPTTQPTGIEPSEDAAASSAEPVEDPVSTDAIDAAGDTTTDESATVETTEELAVGDHGPASCTDLGLGQDTAAPEQLAAVGIPFYECVAEMSAVPGSDPVFVGEYDSAQESIVLEMFFKDEFERSDWEIISNSVDGENAITQAQKPGYFVVVAIGPSRTPGAVSSIHYTLRTQ